MLLIQARERVTRGKTAHWPIRHVKKDDQTDHFLTTANKKAPQLSWGKQDQTQRCSLPSPIQTILSALESHQINRLSQWPVVSGQQSVVKQPRITDYGLRITENGSRAWLALASPPVGNFTLPRRLTINLFNMGIILKGKLKSMNVNKRGWRLIDWTNLGDWSNLAR